MSANTTFPAPAQIRDLPLQACIEVPAEWEDRNGHVGVARYLDLYQMAAWNVLHEVGVDRAWFDQRQRSQFDLEHHLYYRAELQGGETVCTYNRVLGKTPRLFHGMFFILSDRRDCLAATVEYITAHIDMTTRRVADFPGNLSLGLDRLLEKHAALDWPAPVCGSLSLPA